VTLAVLGLVLGVAGVTAEGARAEPPIATQPYNQNINQEQLRDLIARAETPTATPDPPVPADLDSGKARRGLWRARAAARVLPALRVLGPVGLALSAPEAVMGYKVTIGAAINYFKFGTFALGLQTTATGVPYYTSITPTRWDWYSAVPTPSSGNTTTGRFVQRSTSVRASDGSTALLKDSYHGPCSPVGHAYCPGGSSETDVTNRQAALTKGSEHVWGIYVNSPAQANKVMMVYLEAEFEKLLTLEEAVTEATSDPAWYTTLPAAQKATATYTRPADAGTTTADVVAARAALDGEPAPDARTYINRQLDPSYSGASDIVLPNCVGLSVAGCTSALDSAGHTGTRTYTILTRSTLDLSKPSGAVVTMTPGASSSVQPNSTITLTRNPDVNPIQFPTPTQGETYAEYLARLQALGWLGAVTVSTLSEAAGEPGLGPDAPVTLRLPATTDAVRTTVGPRVVYVQAPWPSPGPRVYPDEPVEFQKNPTSYQQVPKTSAPAAGGAPAGGETGPVCDLVALNFGPLTSLNPGSQMPFGVLTWLLAAYDGIGSVPLSFTISGANQSIATTLSNSAWETDYRPRVFLITEFFFTLLAVVFLARSALKMDG